MPVFVNNIEITDDEIHKEMQYHSASQIEEARYKSARALVIKKILVLKAVEKGFLEEKNMNSLKPVDTAIETLLEENVSIPEVTEETLEIYYNANKDKFLDAETKKQLEYKNVKHLISNYIQTQSMRNGVNIYLKNIIDDYKIIGLNLGDGKGGFTA